MNISRLTLFLCCLDAFSEVKIHECLLIEERYLFTCIFIPLGFIIPDIKIQLDHVNIYVGFEITENLDDTFIFENKSYTLHKIVSSYNYI